MNISKEHITSFYPGPSQVYPNVGQYLFDAIEKNITGINHRSSPFIEIIVQLKKDFKDKLNVPNGYEIGFLCSATEAWGVLANSFCTQKTVNFYNGSFGAKWYSINKALNANTESIVFGLDEPVPIDGKIQNMENGLICLCQNETSNGTQIESHYLKTIRENHPNAIIAIDATSSMAGIELNWALGDIWFASVQKCFGLPAGLCVVVMSPRVKDILPLINKQQYNNIAELYGKSLENQTIHTPNTLNIYSLSRLLQDIDPISTIAQKTATRATEWRNFLKNIGLSLLPQNPAVLSETVLTINYPESQMAALIKKIETEGFILGKGYGEYAKNTFRIANFPAMSDEKISELKEVLSKSI
jgi:phosphoserine aminotransferase